MNYIPVGMYCKLILRINTSFNTLFIATFYDINSMTKNNHRSLFFNNKYKKFVHDRQLIDDNLSNNSSKIYKSITILSTVIVINFVYDIIKVTYYINVYRFYSITIIISKSNESFVEISSNRLIDGGAAYYPSDIRLEAITYSRQGWVIGYCHWFAVVGYCF